MTEQSVVCERRGAILVITINRPRVRNALDQSVGEGVAAAADLLESDDDLRVGVLTGAGGTFSSGMDLKAFLRGESPDIEGRGLCGIVQRPPTKPMVAAVEGWALAGGFELVLACDLVVAASTARFGLPEVKRSLVAAAGGALHLPRRLPPAIALEMLLVGEPFDAKRAQAVGLVNQVVDEGQALDAAVELALKIAANGPLAVGVTKQIATMVGDWSSSEAWTRQKAVIDPVFASEDAREGAAAFAERREPVWRGR